MLYCRSAPVKKSKALIIGAIAAVGAALVIACAITVGVIFGVNRLSEFDEYLVI